MPRIRMTIAVTEELYAWLTEQAKRERRTISALAGLYLEEARAKREGLHDGGRQILREALEDTQWRWLEGQGPKRCPTCGMTELHGHATSCVIGQALVATDARFPQADTLRRNGTTAAGEPDAKIDP